jgi:hypothetical protein
MAIQVGGTTVVNNSRALQNIASVDATTAASITAAGVGGGSGVAGISWATVVSGTTVNLDGVATDGSGTWIVVGQGGKVLRSTNNGVSWSTVSTPVGTGSDFTCVGYGNGVWVIGIKAMVGAHFNQCIRSTNGGATWATVQHNLNKQVFEVETDGSGTWILSADRQQISRSTNGGVSWSTISFGGDFRCNQSATDGSGNWVVCDGYYVRIRTSTDNGATWTQRAVGSGTGLHYGVATNGSGEWVVTGTGGTFRSTNLTTWTSVPMIYSGRAFYYDSDVGAYIISNAANVFTSSTDGYQTSSTNFSGVTANIVRGDNNGTFIGVGNGGLLYRGTI